MAVNFGELDYYGTVPANELKAKLRDIAYKAIHELSCDCKDDSAVSFREQVAGIVYVTEMLCDQIDEEVAHKNAEMQWMMKEYTEGLKDEQAT